MPTKSSILSAYRRYAPFYDRIYGPLLEPGRREAVASLDLRAGSNVLEVGTGTGLSLGLYSPEIQVTAMDLSPEMLALASRRVQKAAWAHIKIVEGDASATGFRAGQFDAVCAMYIASVAEDPRALLRELCRVCRTGGKIVLVNHFSGGRGWVDYFERALRPLGSLVGFEPWFPLNSMLEGNPVEILASRPVNLGGYWNVIVLKNKKKI